MNHLENDEALLRQLTEFNRTECRYSADLTVVKWLEDVAASSTDRPAIYDDGRVYTYGSLNRDSNRLAYALMKREIGPGSIVAIKMPRSYPMMVCIYGILKAGAAYLPLDPGGPPSRLNKMLADSSAALVLVKNVPSESAASRRPEGADPADPDTELTTLEALELERYPDSNPGVVLRPDDLAYLIYTSGSTGDPKGVLLEHGGLMNRLEWMQKAFPLTSSDVLFQKTVYTFDVSVWELMWWTVSGASVVLLPSGKENDPRRFVKLIERHGISVIHFVPSVLRLFLEYVGTGFDLRRLNSLRYVFCSGEALPADLVRWFYTVFPAEQDIKLINLYGPTEATIDVSSYPCKRNHKITQPVPIGKPIDNTRFYILREDLTCAGLGETGQLYIGGTGLARGYLNSPALTHSRFVPNPYEPGERMYRTGDLAYWTDQGEVVYVGREDHQIKLRGLRIELGEIEHCLLCCGRIKNAIAGVHINELGDQILTAYVVGGTGSGAELQRELQNELARMLPEYAIPTHIVKVEEIPLKPNGKADRGMFFPVRKETTAQR